MFKLHNLCQRGGELGDWIRKVKGLRSINRFLQNSHGDVKYSIGNIVNSIVITVWCQVGPGNIRG